MFIFIARHAWAGEYGDPRWPDDSLRELTSDGIQRYTKVVKTLVDRGFNPERIATSPYARCRQTAEIIASYATSKPKIDELEALEPGSDFESVLEWSMEHAGEHDSLCWVGHSPDVEWLTSALVGDGASSIRFAKGAIAAVGFDSAIAPGGGQLYWHATAKLLGL